MNLELKVLKKLLLVIVTLFVLFIAVILVGPSLINWNNYKADLTNEVELLSGRKLIINGDINISVLPAPAIVAHDVSLSNSVGASAKNMFTLKSLEVRVALGPLLSGQVKVKTVRLIDPVIELQRFADGHTNLDFFFIKDQSKEETSEVQIADTELAEANENSQFGEKISKFSLDNFSIENASLNYRDDVLGRVEKIENFDATFAAASPSGPFASAGNMVVGGLPLEYTISVDKIIEERTAPLSLTISSKPGQTKTSFSGAVIGLDETPRFEGLVRTTGKNLAQLVQFVSPRSALPGLLGQEFGIEASVAASAEAADISELSISLGDAVAKGSAGLNIKGTPSANIDIALDSLDLDSWLAFPKIKAMVTDSQIKEKNQTSGTEGETSAVSNMNSRLGTLYPSRKKLLPDVIDVTFNVTAESLAFSKGLVRQARLSAELSGGEVTISHASANLPGNASVDLFGFVLTDEFLPRFDGKMEVSVGNVRGMMNWLNIPMPSVPADRLLKMVLSGNVEANQSKISLNKVDLQFDSSRLTGKTALYLDDRLSLDADLTLDRINLDTYLANSKTKSNLKVVSEDPKLSPVKKLKKGKETSSASLAILKNFDANVKSKIKTLVYGNTQIKSVDLDMSLQDGTVDVRHLSVEKMAGSTLKAKGSLSDFDGMPKMKGVRLEAKFNDPSRFFRLLGKNIPMDSKALGTVELEGKIDGPVFNPSVVMELEGAGAKITTAGKISFLPLISGFDGDLKVVLGDLVGILNTLGVNYRLGGKPGAFDLDSKIKADGSGLILSNLKAHLGSVPVNGNVKFLLGGDKTKIEADLTSGRIALNHYFPVPHEALPKKTKPSFPVARPAAGGLQEKIEFKNLADFSPGRWPTNPVDFSFLEDFDANIRFKSEALAYGNYSIKNSMLDATVDNGVLKVSKFSGELFGGTIDANSTAKAGSPLTIESAITLKEIRLEEGLLSAIGESPAKGRAALNIKFDASGYTVSDLVASLKGNGSISLKGINVSGKGKGTTFSSVLGLLFELKDFGKKLSKSNASGGVADITGTFNISRGIAQSSDFLLTASMGNGQAQGKVDLSRWLINMAGQFEFSPNFIGKILIDSGSVSPKLPFFIRGDLNAPSVKLDTSKLISGKLIKKGLDKLLNKKGVNDLLQNFLPGLGQKNQKSKLPTQETNAEGNLPPSPSTQKKQVPPKEILKNLLEGLGR